MERASLALVINGKGKSITRTPPNYTIFLLVQRLALVWPWYLAQKSRFGVPLLYFNITVSVWYKNNIGEDDNYLDDLVCIVPVPEMAINTPVLIERLPLPLLLLLC